MEERRVFVTVGTTSFDDLVKAVSTKECLQVLKSRGYSSLIIQLGRGSFIPPQALEDGMEVEYFTFTPNLAEYLNSAALIISHAGSGSIFETLRAGRPLVVVVNNALMDNHQSELAEELSKNKFLICASPETIVESLKNMNLDALTRYPPGDPSALVKILDNFLGFVD